MNIDYTKTLSEEFIREFQNEVNWEEISLYQKLNENFIREFYNKVYWNNISSSQILSENFIEEFQDKINWYFISLYQNLSEKFIKDFKTSKYNPHNRKVILMTDLQKIESTIRLGGTFEDGLRLVQLESKQKNNGNLTTPHTIKPKKPRNYKHGEAAKAVEMAFNGGQMNGKTQAQLARELGCSQNVVCYTLKKLKLLNQN
jgi:hypothetical protein